jgi:hypothetical protein
MATTRRPRKQTKHLLFPNDREIKSTQRELPKFKPHDLRSLIKGAKANDQEELKIGVLLAFRRRNDEQLKQLLQGLGVDPSKPDAWRTGFFLLAMFHHGVGHLAARHGPRLLARPPAERLDAKIIAHYVAECRKSCSETAVAD